MSRDDDLSHLSLAELFRMEIENQGALLTDGLLALEKGDDPTGTLQQMMRAAHSIKGASRIAGRDAVVRIAHAIEEWLVTLQRAQTGINVVATDQLLRAVDLISRIAHLPEDQGTAWDQTHASELVAMLQSLEDLRSTPPAVNAPPSAVEEKPAGVARDADAEAKPAAERSVRVRAENLTRVLALAGESVIASRRLSMLNRRMLGIQRNAAEFAESIEKIRHAVPPTLLDAVETLRYAETHHRAVVGDYVESLDEFQRHSVEVAQRLYDEVLASRMRPFSDVVATTPRLVRDTARALGKEVRLEIAGQNTSVDRDIAEKLDAPLTHLLRNAIDHGIETTNERREKGKPEAGTIRLEARHAAGMLVITLSDDGRGIDVEQIRSTVASRRLIPPEAAAALSDTELLEFLFLPSFSLRETVTEYSGRGVGLDVVKNTLREIGGRVRLRSAAGAGTEFHLELPLTLSVIRAMLVEIAGEPYALPLSRIERLLKVERNSVALTEGRQHVDVAGVSVGLVTANQVLELDAAATSEATQLSVVIIGERDERYGVVVDRFLNEQELVVRTLDPHLGRIQDISAAAVLDDGTPVLIIDVDDFVRSIQNLVSGNRLTHVREQREEKTPRKRILVVDDSLTVRELERKLLANRGYHVEVAVDGMDGWNAIRTGDYDLVITDVDMPRLDGIELVTRLKGDPRLNATPVMIVSYKDRDEDRRRGLEAGADYYLTKGSFHDETLVQAVMDLIGEGQP